MRLAEAEMVIDAPPERVFDLFTTEVGLCSWMATEATVDLRPGGSWRWVHDNGDACSGTYLTIESPRLLSFTYGWESGPFAHVPPGSTEVTVTFERSTGGTSVRIRHAGLEQADAARHAGGWTHFLGVLERTAAGDHPAAGSASREER